MVLVFHSGNYFHCSYAYGADALEEVYDLFLVVGEAVGVEPLGDGGVAELAFLVLVQDPLQGGAAAQLVLPRFRGDAGEGGPVVEDDGAPVRVGPEDYPPGFALQVNPFQGVGFGILKADVQVQQFLAHFPPEGEVGVEGEAGELAQQVHAVFLAVGRVVEDGVGVGEDVLGGDAVGPGQFVEMVAPLPPVVAVELPETPVGYIADPLPLGSVAVEGETI